MGGGEGTEGMEGTEEREGGKGRGKVGAREAMEGGYEESLPFLDRRREKGREGVLMEHGSAGFVQVGFQQSRLLPSDGPQRPRTC